MKIICIGYFDKNSRFFLDIKKQVKNRLNKKTKLRVYSIYFSGFLYTLFRFNFSCWLPIKAWFLVQREKKYYLKALSNSNTYKTIIYDDYINFHLGLDNTIAKQHLQLQALAYIDIFEATFNNYKPDVLLTIGDSRLCFEMAIAIAKSKKIKVYYLEQGPFNTTFFDDKGVNNNLSAATNFYCDNTIKNDTKCFQLNQKTIKYNRSYLYRGLDILLKFIFENTYLYPPDIKKTDIYSYKKKSAVQKASFKSSKNELLLILQIPADVNMIYHSPYFKTHLEIIAYTYNNLPEGFNLVIREHPLYVNKYDKKIYDFVKQHNINIENNIPLVKALTKSSCVVVNNSTVGIEAIVRNKPVIVLGNAFYDNKFICFKYDKSVSLKDLIATVVSKQTNDSCVKQFQNHLFKTVLIDGAMDEKKLKSSKTIAEKIINPNCTLPLDNSKITS